MWNAGRGKLAGTLLPSLRSRWDSRSTRCGNSRGGGGSVVGRSGGMARGDQSIGPREAERRELKVAGWEPKGRDPRPSGAAPPAVAGAPSPGPKDAEKGRTQQRGRAGVVYALEGPHKGKGDGA